MNEIIHNNIQHWSHTNYGEQASMGKSIYNCHMFAETDCVCGKKKMSRHPSDKTVKKVCGAFLHSPQKSISRASIELGDVFTQLCGGCYKRDCIFQTYKFQTGARVALLLGYGLDECDQFPAGAMKGFLFLLPTVSRLALGPSQPPIQWVPVVLSQRVVSGE
jgi:hypothetical protein